MAFKNHLVDQWVCNSCSVYRCPSARRLDSGNFARSRSKPPWVAQHPGWCVFITTWIAARFLDQVGRVSAMRIGSVWVMSAHLKSLKLPSGMSSSSVQKPVPDSTSVGSPVHHDDVCYLRTLVLDAFWVSKLHHICAQNFLFQVMKLLLVGEESES